jgi:hypothetical protein
MGLSGDRVRDIIQASGDRLVDINVRLDVIFREFDHLFPDRFPQAAYLAFSQRRWWKRVWVVQELSVSCDPAFLCGDLRISSEHLCNFVDLLAAYGWSTLRRTGHIEGPFDEEAKEKYERIAKICSTGTLIKSMSRPVRRGFSRVLSADFEVVINDPHSNLRLAWPEQRRATAAVRLQRLRECRLQLKWGRAAAEMNLATTTEGNWPRRLSLRSLRRQYATWSLAGAGGGSTCFRHCRGERGGRRVALLG